MNRKVLASLLVTMFALLAGAGEAGVQGPTVDPPELALGIRQAQGGDFEAAIGTLEAAARQLAESGGRPKQLARAYLYLGIAYLGLSEEQKAKAKFVEALKADADLELSAAEYPPKVVQFFQQALAELEEAPQRASPRAEPAEESSEDEEEGKEQPEDGEGADGSAARVFKGIDFFETQGGEERRRDARLILDPSRREIVIADEEKGPAKAAYLVIRYDAVVELIYERSSHRRWKTGFLKTGRKHGLSITFEEGTGGERRYAYLRLGDRGAKDLLGGLEAATGLKVVIISDQED